MTIEGLSSNRCAVIGSPVGHSLSPALHQAAYTALGLDWSFEAIEVTPVDLASFMAGLDNSWRGLAVTRPHKEALLAYGQPDQASRRLSAGNTIVFGQEGATIHNTDVSGFVHALEHSRLDAISDVVMLGAGATARAALMALANLGVAKVAVQVRRPESASQCLGLADDLDLEVEVTELGRPQPADLLLSTLPPEIAETWAEAMVAEVGAIFDVNYHPWPTALAQIGLEADLPVVTGLELLAGQAIQQIDLITGDSVEMDLLIAAGQAELRRRQNNSSTGD